MITADACSRRARRGYPSLPQALMASDGESAANAAGVGHRSIQARHTGSTRPTGVCCSITSETRTPQGVGEVRHGNGRRCRSNQARMGSCKASMEYMVERCCHERRRRVEVHGLQQGASYPGSVDSLMKPIGPEPAGVYWRRRAVVVGAVLLVLFAVIMLWPSAGETESTAATAAPTTLASPNPSPSATSASPSPSATDEGEGASPSPTSTTVAECSDNDINVETRVDTADARVGQPVAVSMTIANISGSPCTRDVGPVVNEFLITSGGYRVWSSDDCNPGGPSQIETIPVDQAFVVQASWPTIVTSPGCPSPQQLAQAGSYDVTGANGRAVGSSAAFALGQ